MNFWEHFKVITTKVNKTVGLLLKLAKTSAKTGINDNIKNFMRTYLDYGDVIYDEVYSKTFHQ